MCIAWIVPTRHTHVARPARWLLILAVASVLSVASEAAGDDAVEPRAGAVQAEPGDWTYWRGPEQNGVSRETGLPDSLDPRGETLDWERDDLGGRSTPIVMNGRLYTLLRDQPGTPHEGEKVVCLDPESGETLWENVFRVWSSDVPDTRVGWSSVVGDPETGNVYALGVCGYFLCIDGETGETLWDLPLHEQFGMLTTYGGRTNYPVVFEDLVLISGVITGWGELARPAHRFLAFDKRTGDVVWFKGTELFPYDTTYSSPILSVLGDQAAMVFGSGDGAVWAFQPRTGERIWNYPLSRRGLYLTPLVVGDRVFMGHSEENILGTSMGALAALDGTGRGDLTDTPHVLWQTYELMVGRSTPLYVDGRLYAIDDRARLLVVDADTGEVVARQTLGTVQRGSPLYADGKIYAVEVNGRWYVMEPDDEDGVRILARGRLPRSEVLASPIAAQGRLFVQTTESLYAFRDPSKEPGYVDRPEPREEPPVDEEAEPAHLQIVPAEALLRPGEQQSLTVRLFNGRGQLLGEAEATFEIRGPGSVTPQGVFQAAADAAHTATYVTARAGGLEAQARIRVVPDLPWQFDFAGLDEPPVTWVGARYRHVIRKLDDRDVMVKISTIPLGTRSQCWFGQWDLSDYTMQADVRGAEQMGRMPDIGLIVQGYTLDLQGELQALQIRSWVSHDRRTQESISFAWQPDVWYRVKFQASNQDGTAVLRGKVWPRDEAEPAEWTIEMVDEAPVTRGSPGLFGNATDAELYLDNIRVYANDSPEALAGP